MKKIIVIEDDDGIRDLILYSLKSSNFDGVGYESGVNILDKIKDQSPDLLILDIMLPDIDGLKILDTIRLNYKTENLPVILLTAKNNEIDILKGLDSGADDYITKPFSILELISRIKVILRRSNNKENTNILKYKSIEMFLDKRSVKSFDEEISLTNKEFEILYLLISKSETVITREKLMDNVWGFDFEGESRTIDMHMKTLRKKLKDSGSLIKTIRGIGYKLEG